MKNKTFFKINLIYFTAMLCVAVVFVLGYAGIIQNDILSSFLIQIVVMFGIPLLMYTLLISKNTKQSFKDVGFKKISGKMVCLTIALGFVLYFINSFVADAFSSIIALFGYENLYGSTTIKLTYGLLLKDFILSAILPGFCEEFLHRGIMLFANKKVNNPRYCLIISSLLFGLMHLNINQFFYAAILGGFMGYVDLCADSIYPSMIMHFMNNFLSSYFFYGYYLNWPFARFANDFSATLRGNIVVFIIATTCGILLLFACYKLLTKLMAHECAKNKVRKILSALQTENLTYEEMQLKIQIANQILNAQFNLTNNNDINQINNEATQPGNNLAEYNSTKNNLDENNLTENNNSFEKESATKAQSGTKQKHSSFLDKVFLISAFFLGGLITIITFIWEII